MKWLRDYWFRLLIILLMITGGLWFNRPDLLRHPELLNTNLLHTGFFKAGHVYASQQGISEIISSTTAKPPKYALHILFIGNSFTFFHDIPQQLADIASADPGNQTQFIIQSVTRGAIGLKELWDDGNAEQLIQNGPAPGQHWDYVVLQEQSSWAMMEEFVYKTYKYTGKFDQLIKLAKAKTLLVLTWVDKPGSPQYMQYDYLRNPDYMYKRFAQNTQELAAKLGATEIPVGTYWQFMLSQEPLIDLYEADGQHPNAAGAYLAALVFYYYLSGHDLMPIDVHPDAISEEAAKGIKTVIMHPGGTQ